MAPRKLVDHAGMELVHRVFLSRWAQTTNSPRRIPPFRTLQMEGVENKQPREQAAHRQNSNVTLKDSRDSEGLVILWRLTTFVRLHSLAETLDEFREPVAATAERIGQSVRPE